MIDFDDSMDDISYETLLETPDSHVLAFKEFGYYQGTWIAKVRYKDKIIWIKDYYGSCSGCDTLEHIKMSYCSFPENKEALQEKLRITNVLAEMAKDYLENGITFEELEAELAKDMKEDSDTQEAMKFIQEKKDE